MVHTIQNIIFVWFSCGAIFIESNLVEQVPGEPHTVCEGATSLHRYIATSLHFATYPGKTLHKAGISFFASAEALYAI